MNLQTQHQQQVLLFDLEADGLLDSVTQIWCGASVSLPTLSHLHLHEGYVAPVQWQPTEIPNLIRLLKSAKTLIGHNILGYDLPAVWKCNGDWETKPLILDTLVLSRFLHPERYGGHSLEAWGERLNFAKTPFTDFTTYTPEMLEYCTNDVLLNYRVLIELLKEFKEKYNGATITKGFSVYT